MNTSEQDIELIENYLDDKLTQEEVVHFNERLKNDSSFEKLFEFRKKIQNTWTQANEFESTKSFLKKLDMKNTSSGSSKKLYWAIAVAAMFILIVPITIKLNKPNNQLQMNELESKATVEFLDDRFKQLYPVQGQIVKSGNIMFTWESALDVKTAIVLTELESKEVYIISPITSDLKNYLLKDTMPPGKYEWKMEGFKGKKLFIIK